MKFQVTVALFSRFYRRINYNIIIYNKLLNSETEVFSQTKNKHETI